jgi:phosphatidylglycerol---prolipoprotein diacylglyceryl transferase
MHPILFEVPGVGFPVRMFGVMLGLGFLAGAWLFSVLVARFSKTPERDVEAYGALPTWILFGIILGARMLYVIVEIARGSPVGREFVSEPWTMIAVWQGGLVMYGGFIGAVVGGVWCAKRQHLRPLHAMDLGMVAGFVGQAIGRVGCLLVGDDYGSRVPQKWSWLPFPITLRVPDPLPPESLFGAENAGQLLWATQPMMSFKALIVAAVSYWVLKRRRYEGQAAWAGVTTYALLRFVVEFFRGDEVRGVWFGGALSTSQLISLVAGSASLAMLLKNRSRRDFAPVA